MRGNKRGKDELPDNMTLKEASEFWDKHSFLDYNDIQEVKFDITAQSRGVSAETLVNLWLKSMLHRA